MGQGHVPFVVVDNEGLHIPFVVRAGGGIAHMAHHHFPLSQTSQALRREHLIHQSHVAPSGKAAVIVDHHARALLSAVLQGVKAVIGQPGHISPFRRIYAEYTALLVEMAPIPCLSRAGFLPFAVAAAAVCHN